MCASAFLRCFFCFAFLLSSAGGSPPRHNRNSLQNSKELSDFLTPLKPNTGVGFRKGLDKQ
jgi:hypothetical protein